MSDEIRVRQQPPVTQSPMPQETMQKASAMPWIILAVVVVVIAVLAVIFRGQLFGKSSSNGAAMTSTMGTASGYQAVFLSNGQVYFGKISSTANDFITLKDIYYLQVVQQPPLQGTPQGTQADAQAQQSISLVKLGEELHGPVDEMHINRTQVLFYEDLKTEGQVVKAIQDYKTKQAQPTPAK